LLLTSILQYFKGLAHYVGSTQLINLRFAEVSSQATECKKMSTRNELVIIRG